MRFEFRVAIEIERESGKFMGKDEARDQLREALEEADPGTIEGGADGDSVYNTIEWDVADV